MMHTEHTVDLHEMFVAQFATFARDSVLLAEFMTSFPSHEEQCCTFLLLSSTLYITSTAIYYSLMTATHVSSPSIVNIQTLPQVPPFLLLAFLFSDAGDRR